MTHPPHEEIEISWSATFGALFSVLGEILFGLTLFSLVLRSLPNHGGDPAPERVCLSITGGFVTLGWLLLRGKPRGGVLRIPGGAQAIKSLLTDVFYPALAMFAVFCISIVAITIIAAMISALFAYSS